MGADGWRVLRSDWLPGLDQEELLPSFQRLDCCQAGKKAEEQVEEVVVVVVVVVVDLLVGELF